jgi:hypothetical protein
VVLIGGGVITIAFTYLFGLENTVVHTLMVASLALIIALSLFTVAALDHPFKGDLLSTLLCPHDGAWSSDHAICSRLREHKAWLVEVELSRCQTVIGERRGWLAILNI